MTTPAVLASPRSSAVLVRLRRHELLIARWPSLEASSRRRGTRAWHPMLDARLRVRRLEATVASARRAAAQLDLFGADVEHPDDSTALGELLDEIPPVVRQAVAPYAMRQHALLQLAGVDPRAWRLLLEHRYGGNPGLVFALARQLSRTAAPAERARLRAMIMRRRGCIAQNLGFTGSRTALRALARMHPSVADEQFPLYLSLALSRPAALPWLRCLEHTSSVASFIVWRWRRYEMLSVAFLHDCANYGSWSASAVYDLLRTYERDSRLLARTPRRVRSVDELYGLACDMRELRESRVRGSGRFPDAPLDLGRVGDGLTLVPLRTADAVADEGREMAHCIAIHSARIARAGDVFAYRLEGKERGSVLLERRACVWRVLEMRGVRNSALSVATRRLIRDAVERAQRRG